MKQFGEVSDIIDYLNEKLPRDQKHTLSEMCEVVTPAFISPLVDDHTSMMVVSKLVRLRTNKNIADIVRYADLSKCDLSFYKFFILCGVRGEMTLENFEEQVRERQDEQLIQTMARHKDFPFELKTFFYNFYGDTSFLPQEAQDIFIF